ncbi:pyridine nucleotide-disulfide oxidoreductase domain-containing protein [Besnoitia besnoiti]|uniref:Pyridine nucleotide-disulfide oxidoreductase domain-containing protein n=1 Tax=Besnoitia besnoiti TaxID=94643 RepID=A0A2A9M7Z1_BESBE|nr:pyridine nucleotide-disulfide oxidoreductase domain-containing protein [Besnoitia besnoiti]PFH33294.1 pyridine nucleotide-disulfide oxidoreductase domain-containing protein [Besnoitia besnoiti]
MAARPFYSAVLCQRRIPLPRHPGSSAQRTRSAASFGSPPSSADTTLTPERAIVRVLRECRDDSPVAGCGTAAHRSKSPWRPVLPSRNLEGTRLRRPTAGFSFFHYSASAALYSRASAADSSSCCALSPPRRSFSSASPVAAASSLRPRSSSIALTSSPPAQSSSLSASRSLASSAAHPAVHLARRPHDFPRRVCIVGAGPAGFYCAKYLQKAAPDSRLRVDMLETLPAPYGLVRYGVAPDHPEVKRVTEDFDAVASQPGFRFFGNVTFGTDISLEELRTLYDAVILAYGASGDRALHIPGSDLRGCLSARAFVGFYNAHPACVKRVAEHLPPLPPLEGGDPEGLNPPAACVVGNGNVALDVARILVKAREKLSATDIHSPALDWFTAAGVRHVSVLGRRGWVQTSFTNKELRELVTDDRVLAVVDPQEFEASLTESSLQELSESRLKQRSRALFEHMMKNWDRRESTDLPVIHLRFLTSPVRALPQPNDPSRIGALEVARNRLEGPPGAQRAVPVGEGGEENAANDANTPTSPALSSRLPASLLIWSIGFKSLHAPNLNLPIARDTGALVNERGRVVPPTVDRFNSITAGGVYASGWVRRGPQGVIATNILDARETVNQVLADLRLHSNPSAAAAARPRDASPRGEEVSAGSGARREPRQAETPSGAEPEARDASRHAGRSDSQAIETLDALLVARDVQPLSFRGWLAVKEEERTRGEKRGKRAEKIPSAREMLAVAKEKRQTQDGTL